MAEKTQGAIFAVGTATASTKVITAITAANPPQVTSATHGYANGAIVFITGVVGMTQVNNRAFVVANQATNTFELKGVDGTSYTAYASAGTAALKTMTTVGETRVAGPGLDGESQEIDTTNLLSTSKEFLLGLSDDGTLSGSCFITTDTGQARLRSLRESGALEAFSITMPSGKVLALMGRVKSFGVNEISPDNALQGSFSIRVSNAVAWFA